jgi:hypothetical protein
VTCYFRHLGDIFQKAGIVLTSQNRKEIEKVIQGIVGMEGKHCPDVWREVKKRINESEPEFISELKGAWENRSRS